MKPIKRLLVALCLLSFLPTSSLAQEETDTSSPEQTQVQKDEDKKEIDILTETDGGKKVITPEGDDITEEVKKPAENPYLDRPLTYLEFKDDLDRFTSKVWFGEDLFGFNTETNYLFNTGVQAVFWVNKFIFMINAEIYDFLSHDLAKDNIATVLLAGAGIFDGFKVTLLPWIGSFMAVYLAYLHFVRGQDFFKYFFRLMLFFLLATSYFMKTTNGEYVIQKIYTNITMVTTEMTNSAVDATKNLKDDNLAGAGKDAVLDKYFMSAIWQPYRYMNAEPKVDEDGKVTFDDRLLKGLLAYDSGDDSFEIEGKSIEKIAESETEPVNKMLKAAWGTKYMYAFASILDTTLMGLVINFLVVVSRVAELTILLLILLAPFALIVSMFPTLENILFNIFKSTLGAMILSGMMSMVSIVFLYFYDVLTQTLITIFKEKLILAIVTKYVIFCILWWKRDFFLRIFTGNRVRHFNNSMTRKLTRFGRNMHRQTVGRMQDSAMSKLAFTGAVAGGLSSVARQSMKTRGVNLGNKMASAFNQRFFYQNPSRDDFQEETDKNHYSRTNKRHQETGNKRRHAFLKLQEMKQGVSVAKNTLSHGLNTLVEKGYENKGHSTGKTKASQNVTNSLDKLNISKEKLAATQQKRQELAEKIKPQNQEPKPKLRGQLTQTKTVGVSAQKLETRRQKLAEPIRIKASSVMKKDIPKHPTIQDNRVDTVTSQNREESSRSLKLEPKAISQPKGVKSSQKSQVEEQKMTTPIRVKTTTLAQKEIPERQSTQEKVVEPKITSQIASQSMSKKSVMVTGTSKPKEVKTSVFPKRKQKPKLKPIKKARK